MTTLKSLSRNSSLCIILELVFVSCLFLFSWFFILLLLSVGFGVLFSVLIQYFVLLGSSDWPETPGHSSSALQVLGLQGSATAPDFSWLTMLVTSAVSWAPCYYAEVLAEIEFFCVSVSSVLAPVQEDGDLLLLSGDVEVLFACLAPIEAQKQKNITLFLGGVNSSPHPEASATRL